MLFWYKSGIADNLLKYPDVVSLMKHMAQEYQITSCIVDAEIVAVDPTSGNLQSFQELSNRARKDVKLSEVKVSVCVYAFDLMLLEGDVSVWFPETSL